MQSEPVNTKQMQDENDKSITRRTTDEATRVRKPSRWDVGPTRRVRKPSRWDVRPTTLPLESDQASKRRNRQRPREKDTDRHTDDTGYERGEKSSKEQLHGLTLPSITDLNRLTMVHKHVLVRSNSLSPEVRSRMIGHFYGNWKEVVEHNEMQNGDGQLAQVLDTVFDLLEEEPSGTQVSQSDSQHSQMSTIPSRSQEECKEQGVDCQTRGDEASLQLECKE